MMAITLAIRDVLLLALGSCDIDYFQTLSLQLVHCQLLVQKLGGLSHSCEGLRLTQDLCLLLSMSNLAMLMRGFQWMKSCALIQAHPCRTFQATLFTD